MDNLSRKVAQWRQIMDYHRRSGEKFVDPVRNPLLYDPDFAEVVRREREEHEARQAKQKRGQP